MKLTCKELRNLRNLELYQVCFKNFKNKITKGTPKLIFHSSHAFDCNFCPYLCSNSCLNTLCSFNRISFICPHPHDDEQSFCCLLCWRWVGSTAAPSRGKVTIATKVICILMYFLVPTPMYIPSHQTSKATNQMARFKKNTLLQDTKNVPEPKFSRSNKAVQLQSKTEICRPG